MKTHGEHVAVRLYGVSCVQTWYYFNRYRADALYIKILVGSVLANNSFKKTYTTQVGTVWFADSVHQGLISHTVYYYVISHYDDPSRLAHVVWSILLEVSLNAFIGLLVQGFLTWRIWRLSDRNRVLTVVIVILVLSGFACSIIFTVQSMRLDTWVQLTELKGLSMAVNVLAAATDVVIAGVLFYYLHRCRTGFKGSDTIISKLILYTVSTGALTSICAIASLLTVGRHI
ncbi:hypothetical protein BDN72DRAFT_897544 [Pluteus cervinus]|uniref:Uncharacterized protein n=1 Tax=Pluteus cervinus TaxID=181527 RepID=A0ACD3AU97_9AGAR|nr:hypothetical protein BDN72DRAFT_897544 [Pluteus cervinus]